MNELSQSNTGHQKPKRKNQHQELPPAKKKKHPFSGRVGQTADMMLQFYRAKLELPLEEESNITLESVIEEDNLHTTLNPTETFHLQGVKDSKGILNIEPIEFQSSYSDLLLEIDVSKK